MKFLHRFYPLAVLAISIIFLLPIYWVLIQSLNSVGSSVTEQSLWWVSDPQWENYVALWELLPFTRYLLNSLCVVAVAVPLTLLSASTAGFALSQLAPQAQRSWLGVSLFWLVIPAAAVWLFRFQIFNWAGLIDTRWVLIVPALAGSNPLFVLFYYWTWRAVPNELWEAAQLDGAGAGRIWWQIARPLGRPTTTAVVLLSFAMYWGDFIDPVLYLYDSQLYTLPIGLQLVNQLDRANLPLLMSAALFMMGPVLFLYGVIQPALLRHLRFNPFL